MNLRRGVDPPRVNPPRVTMSRPKLWSGVNGKLVQSLAEVAPRLQYKIIVFFEKTDRGIAIRAKKTTHLVRLMIVVYGKPPPVRIILPAYSADTLLRIY